MNVPQVYIRFSTFTHPQGGVGYLGGGGLSCGLDTHFLCVAHLIMADIAVCTFDVKEDEDCSDHSDLGGLSAGVAKQLDDNEEPMDDESLLKTLKCVEVDLDEVFRGPINVSFLTGPAGGGGGARLIGPWGMNPTDTRSCEVLTNANITNASQDNGY